jgi:thiol-disulfide isomerase/thioredoxin
MAEGPAANRPPHISFLLIGDTQLPAKLKNLIKAVLAGSAVFAALILYFYSRSEDMPPQTGAMAKFIVNDRYKPAPPITFRDADGNKKEIADFHGQVVLMNFWATWCAPCVRELPSLARLQKELGDRHFTVLAVSTDLKGAADAVPFLKRLKLDALPLYLDPEMALAHGLSVKNLPTTVLFSKRGTVIGHLTGTAEWDSAEAKALIDYFKKR